MPGEVKPMREPSLARIPASCQLVVVAADADWVVGDVRARQIFAESTSVPPMHKQYVLYRTDRHGSPPLVANHTAPTASLPAFDTGEGPLRSFQMARGEVNALDRFGLWRVADVTLEAGFAGRTIVEASGQGALFRDLGRWSDGVAVLRPVVGGDLAAIPRVAVPHGLRLVPWPAPRLAPAPREDDAP